MTVKGFRKGKVPKSVMIAHLGGPDVLRSEAIRESLPIFILGPLPTRSLIQLVSPTSTSRAEKRADCSLLKPKWRFARSSASRARTSCE